MRTTITADVPGGGDQVTTYTYGTTKGVSAGDSEIATGHLLQKVAYPDSTGSSDTVTYAYDTQGRQDWMKDQSGNIIETTFDNAGRQTSRAVTTLASGFNGDVRRIETSYTNRSQVENVTQYDAASSGSIVDQVEYAYTRHGGVEYFYQDMNSAVDLVTPGDHYSVQYGWELSTGGRKSWRRTGVILPSGNTLTYQYSSGIDDEVSRQSIIKDGALRLAEYDYLGYTRVVGQSYAIPDLMQEYYGSTSGDYSGLDRFGRVVRSRWQRDTGSGDIDVYDVELAYDRNSNITLAEDAIIPGRDVEYTMDDLNRLVQAEEGTWSGSSITSKTRDEEWTLDHLGNWDSHQLDLDGSGTYTGPDELDETRTHNAVNELLTRDLDSSGGVADEELVYNAVGQLTDDDAEWQYVYDAFGRLCEVRDQSSDLVAEYRYNGLGFQIAEHTDTNASGGVDGSDLWYYSAFDERWRKLATFRSSDSDPKEEFVPHNAGLNGMGGSSYINDTVLRDRDDNELWEDASDGVLEQRIFYLNNWRGDVVGLVTSAGYQGEFVRYSAYGTPFNYPGGDANSDGETNATDGTVISGWVSGMTYNLRGDLDLDGDVDAVDSTAFSSAYRGVTGGRDELSTQGNLIGFSGGNQSGDRIVFRKRAIALSLGVWNGRDQFFLDGLNSYAYVRLQPLSLVDPTGAFGVIAGAGVSPTPKVKQQPPAGVSTPSQGPVTKPPAPPITHFPLPVVGDVIWRDKTGVGGYAQQLPTGKPGEAFRNNESCPPKVKVTSTATSGYFISVGIPAGGTAQFGNCDTGIGCAFNLTLKLNIEPDNNQPKDEEEADWHNPPIGSGGSPNKPEWYAWGASGPVPLGNSPGVTFSGGLTGSSEPVAQVDFPSIACGQAKAFAIGAVGNKVTDANGNVQQKVVFIQISFICDPCKP